MKKKILNLCKGILVTLLWTLCLCTFAQNIFVTGTVTDTKGEPLIGVSIQQVGTSTGTITDIEGKFIIENISSEATLNISYIGMRSQMIYLKGRTILNIVMKEDIELLEEVVVIGYGTQKKGILTGAISNVKSKKLTLAPIGNVSNMMTGQLPGVITKQLSGIPGDDTANINIRGFGTPLIIVDGVESTLSNIDPWQIESISVLKDGAASIFGSRAGNGVVVITTKRGTAQKPTISVNSSFTLQGSTKIHHPQNSGQRAQLMREAHINQGLPIEQAPYTEEQIVKYFEGTDPNYLNSDWFKATIRDYAPQQNHNIGISGGTEALKFYGFFGNNEQETIIKHDGGSYNRYNFQASVDAKITRNMTLMIDVNSIYEDRVFSYLGLFGGSNLWGALYGSDPKLPITLPDEGKLAYGGIGYGNVIAAASTKINGYNRTRDRQHRVSGTLKYDIKQLPGLNLKAFVGKSENSTKLKEFRKQNNFYRYNYETGVYTFERSGQDPTTLTESYNAYKMFTQQYSINYENLFANIHWITVMGLYENIVYEGDYFSGSRSGFMSTSLEQLSAGNISTSYANGGASEMGRISWIGRINYTFKDKYLLETILRADASAKFPKSKRWGCFPSVSIGWIISQEEFMSRLPMIENLKIRTSYGESGNDGVGNFQYLSGYGFDGQYILGDTTYSGLYVTGIANPVLTWEKMKIYNFGIDFGLWNRQIYGSADVFYRLRDGIPGTRIVSLPSSFGTELPLENLNAINTRGVEIIIGTRQKFSDLTVNLSGNITWARSKWDKYDEPEYTDPDQLRLNKKTGEWTDRQFGYVSDGLFSSQEQIEALTYTYNDLGGNSSLRPGDVIYKDTNGDGVLDWRDKVEIGSGSMPRWIYGIMSDLSYKFFDLSFLFQGAFGYHTYIDMESVQSDLSYRLRWTQENNNSNALIPRRGGASTNGYYSDYRLHKASYIRLKNASIGYEVPKTLLKQFDIERLRIYLAGTNLFTISSLSKYGVDPELPDSDGPTGMPINTVCYYPQQCTYSVGINLTF